MMRKLLLPYYRFAACGLFFIISLVLAELPPGAYEQLLKSSKELLVLEVINVTRTNLTETDECLQDFTVAANILDVINSTCGIMAGENITFSSYYVNKTDESCVGFVGPEIPPLLEPGWCGLVYLNPIENTTNFDIAAYGKSFIDYTTNGTCGYFIYGNDDHNMDDDENNNV